MLRKPTFEPFRAVVYDAHQHLNCIGVVYTMCTHFRQHEVLTWTEWILASTGDAGQHLTDIYSPIGVVPKLNNKFSLIQNLRVVNDSCCETTFQCEDIKTFAQLIEPKDYLDKQGLSATKKGLSL